jgi:hypothetical protein
MRLREEGRGLSAPVAIHRAPGRACRRKVGRSRFRDFHTAPPVKNAHEKEEKPRRRKPAHSPSRATMSTHSGMWVSDTTRPTFDPNIDIATVVFSHVQCVETRVNLALVSKLWRDASKPAAAYPLRFDWGGFPDMFDWFDGDGFPCRNLTRVICLLNNDEALSLPYERVVGLLGEAAEDVCEYSAFLGSVRLLKWTRVNNLAWGTYTCSYAAMNGHLPALKYLHENGCPWNSDTCRFAAEHGHLPALQYLHENGCPWGSGTCDYAAGHKNWDCLQYAVDNKCPGWEHFAEKYAEHLS